MATTALTEAIGAYVGHYWYVPIGACVLFGIGFFILFLEIGDMKKFSAGAAAVRKKCYKDKKTLARLVDKSGTEIEFVSVTDSEHPGLIETDEKKANAALVNPNLVAVKRRGRLSNGIPTLNYSLPYHFPMSFTDALAITQLVQQLRNNDALSWIADDFRLIGLISCPDKYLTRECEAAIGFYVGIGGDIPEQFLPFDDDEGEDDFEEYEGDDE